ncbi:MAG: carbohydrate ABC transporter permease [Treponema sp.]|nr:carbohydrate ABC transporter permease [Treponema sp.]
MKKNSRPLNLASKSDRLFNFIVAFIASFALVVTLYPLVFVISASISSPFDLMAGSVWLLPKNMTLGGYKVVLEYDRIWTGFYNSLLITVGGTLINLFVTIIAAYPLSRKDLKLRKPILMMFTFTMLFSGGLIPTYLLIRNLGMYNTRWALVIPNAMSMFNFMITRTFFASSIPGEMLESAKIDGCSDFRFIRSIVIPLSGAIIAVITLYYAVSHWNAYFNAMIYVTNRAKQPLQIVLREILILNTSDQMMEGTNKVEAMYLAEQMKYSLIVLASLPLLIAYPFVQRFFVKGVMIGALKG